MGSKWPGMGGIRLCLCVAKFLLKFVRHLMKMTVLSAFLKIRRFWEHILTLAQDAGQMARNAYNCLKQ